MVSMVVDCGAGCLMQVSPVGLMPLWDLPKTYCPALGGGRSCKNPLSLRFWGEAGCICVVTPMGWCHPCQCWVWAGWWRCGAAWGCCAPTHRVSDSTSGADLVAETGISSLCGWKQEIATADAGQISVSLIERFLMTEEESSVRQVFTGSACYCRRGAGSATLMYLELQGPAAAGDGIGGSGAMSLVVLQALGGGAPPQGFPSAPLPWVISRGWQGAGASERVRSTLRSSSKGGSGQPWLLPAWSSLVGWKTSVRVLAAKYRPWT